MPQSSHRFFAVWPPPHSIVFRSISCHHVQEPCSLRGYLARVFPSLLLPSPPVFSYFPAFISSVQYYLQAIFAPTHCPSLPCTSYPHSGLLFQPPCCPSSPLSAPSSHLHRFSLSKIAVRQHNLDVDSSAPDNIGPCFPVTSVVHHWLVGFLAPSTILIVQGFTARFLHPFLVSLGYLCLPSCGFARCDPPFLCSYQGSSRRSGWGVRRRSASW
jgi:hypothetical protein